MKERVLVDTGPLVAILSRRDQCHGICIEQLKGLSPPLLTCWPVLTEVFWLLRHQPLAIQQLLRSFDTGFIRLLQVEQNALPWISEFFKRYRKLGVQLADASLVYLAEREKLEIIFTLDRKDFSVYRINRNRALKILPGTW